uniref:Protein SHQ1 homolog n=1 Tax=Syphacia muris TaxID=451379 RepID=A0A0N5AA30_9BILA
MLTPVFKISQNDQMLFLTVRAPYANIKDTEVDYSGHTVLFYSEPYFLRIYLPKEVCAAEDVASTEYNADSGEFVVKMPKKNPGEFFPNLDMLTELLKPTNAPTAEPLITELEELELRNSVLQFTIFKSLDEKQQKELMEEVFDDVDLKYGYGFGWKRCFVLKKFASEINHLTDLDQPDELPIDERVASCYKYDMEHFNPDYYLADLFEPSDELKECFNYQISPESWDLTDVDRTHLKELYRKALPKLSKQEHYEVALSLVDILYAYLYDFRTTNGEHTVESGWTIIKLSPTLSYFVKWDNAKDALFGAVRRSLCYPLYRRLDLSNMVVKDLKQLISSGRVQMLHCLTDIKTILSTSGEFRYLLNDLYITDYCIWIQSVDDSILEKLGKEVNAVEIDKRELGLDLEELEMDAKFITLNIADKSEPFDSDDEV